MEGAAAVAPVADCSATLFRRSRGASKDTQSSAVLTHSIAEATSVGEHAPIVAMKPELVGEKRLHSHRTICSCENKNTIVCVSNT